MVPDMMHTYNIMFKVDHYIIIHKCYVKILA